MGVPKMWTVVALGFVHGIGFALLIIAAASAVFQLWEIVR